MLKKILQKKKKEITIYALIIFAVVSVFYIAVAFVIQLNTDSSQKSEIIKTEERLVEAERVIIMNKIDRLISDSLFMADILHYYENDYTAEQLQKQWIDFSNRKKIYDQIRYIDIDGNEIVRIEYNNEVADMVSHKELQNKKDRYYFQDTIKIDDNQVYISRIDLNMEKGLIEEPKKPMIRFSTPVYDSSEELKGVVILNYLAEDILTQIGNISDTGIGDVYICNEDGYWIYNDTNHSLEWTFMYEDRIDESFKNEYPEEWERILKEKSGSFITEQGAFSFTNTLVDKDRPEESDDIVLGEGDWYVISYISPEIEEMRILFRDTGDTIWSAAKRSPMVFVLLFILSFIGGVFFVFNREEHDEIKYFSEYDTMTDIYNRRAGFDKLHQMYEKHEDDDMKISICFIDVNGLKEVNDNFGHDDGDELLQTIVEVIKRNIRDRDFVARFGGDEFVIIFEDLDTDGAERVWTRILGDLEYINQTENRKYLVSASHGIETLTYGEAIDDTINRADEKMYEEKRKIKENIKIIR